VIAGLHASSGGLRPAPVFHPELVASSFSQLMFVPGTIVAVFRPEYAIYFWVLAFGGLVVRRLLRPRDGAV
jgi:hypothetical protein